MTKHRFTVDFEKAIAAQRAAIVLTRILAIINRALPILYSPREKS
jgi:hypothetical protein